MDRKTYGDERVVEMLNENFVITKVNAESGKSFQVGDEPSAQRRNLDMRRPTVIAPGWRRRPSVRRIRNGIVAAAAWKRNR